MVLDTNGFILRTAPSKQKAQKMSLGNFLADESMSLCIHIVAGMNGG